MYYTVYKTTVKQVHKTTLISSNFIVSGFYYHHHREWHSFKYYLWDPLRLSKITCIRVTLLSLSSALHPFTCHSSSSSFASSLHTHIAPTTWLFFLHLFKNKRAHIFCLSDIHRHTHIRNGIISKRHNKNCECDKHESMMLMWRTKWDRDKCVLSQNKTKKNGGIMNTKHTYTRTQDKKKKNWNEIQHKDFFRFQSLYFWFKKIKETKWENKKKQFYDTHTHTFLFSCSSSLCSLNSVNDVSPMKIVKPNRINKKIILQNIYNMQKFTVAACYRPYRSETYNCTCYHFIITIYSCVAFAQASSYT